MNIANRNEIRDIKGVVYFGLPIRKFVFSALAMIAGCYTGFKLYVADIPSQLVGLGVMLAATPFAVFGFLRWHGMYPEQIIPTIIRARFTHGDRLYFRPDNHYKYLSQQALKNERRNKKNVISGKTDEKEAQRQEIL